MSVAGALPLTVGDALRLQVFQDSGAALNLQADARTFFSACYLGPPQG
jgi:hypothetical protein